MKFDNKTKQAAKQVATGPDPTWKALYRAGGIAVFLYIVLGIIVPGVLFLIWNYDTGMNGATILRFIASNRSWWIIIQTLTLGPCIIAIAAVVGLVLQPLIDIGYLWWWLFFMIWFIDVGWKLYRLGGADGSGKM